MHGRPIPLGAVPPSTAELQTLLVTRRPTLTVDRGAGAEIYRWTTEALPLTEPQLFICRADAHDFGLTVADAWFRESLPDDLADIPFGDLPTPLAHAVAEMALAPLLTAMERILPEPIRLMKPFAAAFPAWRALAMRPVEDAPVSIVVHIDEVIEEAFVANLRAAPANENAQVDAAAIPIRALLGSQSLDAGHLPMLAPEVIVLLHGSADAPLELVAGHARTRIGFGQAEANILTITSLGAQPMSEDEPDAPPVEGGETTIDAIEVQLDFVLGTSVVTLAELKTLAEGTTLTLDRAASTHVDIYTGGRRLGTGEAVELDGRLGVRITGINGPTDD